MGPDGSFKMVIYNRGPEQMVKITKDPVGVVDELGVLYPSVRIISEAAKIQREQVGDGVIRFLVLFSNLLREGERLISLGLHPSQVLSGYHYAATKAVTILRRSAQSNMPLERSGDRLLDVVDCGRGMLSSELRADILRAFNQVSEVDFATGKVKTERMRVVKTIGGSFSDSKLINGVVIERDKGHPNMSERVVLPKIALIAGKLDIKPLDIKMKGQGHFPIEISITSETQEHRFQHEERRMNQSIVERLSSSGANVVFCRSMISEKVLDFLSRSGILAFKMVDQKDIDLLHEATGAKIISDADSLSEEDLGFADKVEISRDLSTRLTIVYTKKASTILLRGSSDESLSELNRVVRNSITLLKKAAVNPKVVPGGGAIEMHLAYDLHKASSEVSGKEQLAVESFARSLEGIVRSLTKNYGLDHVGTIASLKNFHSRGEHSMGVIRSGCTDVEEVGLFELASVIESLIQRAYEVASLVLRIDDFIYAKAIPIVHKAPP